MQHRPGDSHFLAGLMKAKEDFLAGGTFKIKNGEQVRSWEDVWLGDKPFREFTLIYIELRGRKTIRWQTSEGQYHLM